jgi:hypothetical protein
MSAWFPITVSCLLLVAVWAGSTAPAVPSLKTGSSTEMERGEVLGGDNVTAAAGARSSVSARWANLTGFLGSEVNYSEDMAFDPALNATILYTGPTDDTWSYNAGQWSNLTPNLAGSIDALPGASTMAYDSATGQMILVGCDRTVFAPSCYQENVSTWDFSATGWKLAVEPNSSSPPLVANWGDFSQITPLAYDAESDSLLFVDSSEPGDSTYTWTFSDGNWTNRSSQSVLQPPWYADSDLTYDAEVGCAILYGGFQPVYGQNMSNQTWEYCGGNWTQVATPASGPPASAGAASVYLPDLGGVVMFGGWNFTSYFDTTWLFANSTWSKLSLNGSPPESANGWSSTTFVYDSADDFALLFGGMTSTLNPEDTGASLEHSAWGLGDIPPFALLNASLNPVEVGQATFIEPVILGGQGNLSYAYSGLPPGCPGPSGAALLCVPNSTGWYNISLTVTDSMGRAGIATFILVVVPPVVIDILRTTPSVMDLGTNLSLVMSVSGGFPPYSYYYSGLPAGCQTANQLSINCIPAVMGHFAVVGIANDSHGAAARAQAEVAVYSDLEIQGFAKSFSAIDVGTSLELTVTTSGGAPPLTYSYAGLPANCVSVDNSSIDCPPGAAPGNYTATATVRDATGASVDASVSWTVSTDPTILGVTATPSNATVGTMVNLTAQVEGGSPPYSAKWGDLPVGCEGTGLSLSCRPLSAGHYVPTVLITDHNDYVVQGSTVLNVSNLTVAPSSTDWVSLWVPLGVTGVVAIGLIFYCIARRRGEWGIGGTRHTRTDEESDTNAESPDTDVEPADRSRGRSGGKYVTIQPNDRSIADSLRR